MGKMHKSLTKCQGVGTFAVGLCNVVEIVSVV